jgi:hypothetical protein
MGTLEYILELGFEMFRISIRLSLIALALTLVVVVPVWAAGSGAITSLTASDAPDYGDAVHVASSVRADAKINSSNLYYRIYAPDGVTVVASHTTTMPSMSAGDTYSDSWSTSNSSFPSVGTYTVHLCWSSGGSQSCGIDARTTTFYSVPSLGLFFSLVAVALLALWIWRRRRDFTLEGA